jgi:hypothetical protein
MNHPFVTNNDVVTGNVYVVGYDTNTIQRLNSNCTVANGELKESDEVKEPLSICFNKNSDKLYMAVE